MVTGKKQQELINEKDDLIMHFRQVSAEMLRTPRSQRAVLKEVRDHLNLEVDEVYKKLGYYHEGFA